jgi:glycosyltransferase involved in cell wall biosynthesis
MAIVARPRAARATDPSATDGRGFWPDSRRRRAADGPPSIPLVSSPSPTRRPVAVVVHAYFEEDARVRRKVDALLASGRPVDVFALRRPDEPEVVVDGALRIHHLPVARHQGAGIGTYVVEYVDFLVRAAIALVRSRRRGFALVEVNSLPDFLVFAALPLRLTGVPTLLDLHEAMPEFFRSRFPRAAHPVAHAALRLQERLSIRFASAALTVNNALADRLVGLGVPAAKVTVILNSPSPELFDASRQPARPFMADGRLRLVYAGALTPIYELDVAIRAVATIAAGRPDLDVDLAIHGRGDSEPALQALAGELGIADRVRFLGRVPLEAVPAAVAAADIGLAPTRRDSFTERSLSTKIFEYAAMGKPVVASWLPTIRHYFPDGTVGHYESGDSDDLARAVLTFVDGPAERERAVAATADRLAVLGWDQQAAAYLAVVDRLAGDGISSRAGRPDGSTDRAMEDV